MKNKELVAIDVNKSKAKSKGVAYYRLPEELKEFFETCQEEHEVIGFSWEPGSWNFGVILGE